MARSYKQGELPGTFEDYLKKEVQPLMEALAKDMDKFVRTKGKASAKRIRQATSELSRKFKDLRQYTWQEQGNKDE